MTKNLNLKMEEPKAPAKKKFRKLTKAEEEEYTREMNLIWAKVSDGIQKGEIDMTPWKRTL